MRRIILIRQITFRKHSTGKQVKTWHRPSILSQIPDQDSSESRREPRRFLAFQRFSGFFPDCPAGGSKQNISVPGQL